VVTQFAFSTGGLPDDKRFSAYCDEINKWSCGLEFRVEDNASFQADFSFRRAGATGFMVHTSTAMGSARTSRLIRDGDDSLLVMMLLSGRAQQIQSDSENILQAGDAIICDSAYPGEFNIIDQSSFAMMKFPRSKLSLRLPGRRGFAAARLDQDIAARRLLFGYLTGTHDVDLNGSVYATQLHEDHMIDVVALALGAEGEIGLPNRRPGAKTVRLAAIMREIEQSAADQTFNASYVAVRLGITVRYLHYLLEPTGRTFSEHVLDYRLARSAELLRDPSQSARKIADIAYAVGFRDLSYFNRVFRRRYGGTPSDMRLAREVRINPQSRSS
jgi:AraC-like DNA-binding protein